MIVAMSMEPNTFLIMEKTDLQLICLAITLMAGLFAYHVTRVKIVVVITVFILTAFFTMFCVYPISCLMIGMIVSSLLLTLLVWLESSDDKER